MLSAAYCDHIQSSYLLQITYYKEKTRYWYHSVNVNNLSAPEWSHKATSIVPIFNLVNKT